MVADPYDLQRFVEAQNAVYDDALNELRNGRKKTHWMWLIFPQIRGLGFSSTSQKFAIGSLEEASAYMKHAVLGERLKECVTTLLGIEGRSASQIFGNPDDLKFRSSVTLFLQAAPQEHLFHDALRKYFADEPDPLTIAAVAAQRQLPR